MGLFDWYAKVQLRVGQPKLRQYVIGDAVHIADGIYIAWEGIAVIHGGKLVATFPCVMSKYGEVWDAETALRKLQQEEDGV